MRRRDLRRVTIYQNYYYLLICKSCVHKWTQHKKKKDEICPNCKITYENGMKEKVFVDSWGIIYTDPITHKLVREIQKPSVDARGKEIPSKKMAELKKIELEHQFFTKEYKRPAKEEKPFLLKEAIEKYLEIKRREGKKTIGNDERSLEYFSNYKIQGKSFGEYPVNEITKEMVYDFRVNRCGRVKGSTTNRDLATIRHLFYIFLEDGFLEKNPVAHSRKDGKKLFSKENIRERYLSFGEEHRLKMELEKEDYPYYFKVIVYTALETGMRLGEILPVKSTGGYGLKWSQISFYDKEIHIKKSKSGKSRIIPMSEILWSMLTTLANSRQHKDDDFVFVYDSDRPVRDIRKHHDRLLANSEIFDYSFHCHRHTFGHRMANVFKVPIPVLQKIMGHSSIDVTMRYVQVGDDDVKIAMKMRDEKMQDLTNPIITMHNKGVMEIVKNGKVFDN